MLSRREFLQAAGITLAAAHSLSLSRFGLSSAAPNFQPVFGRALTSAPIHAAPNPTAPILDRLWSDSVTPILDVHHRFYQVANGFTPREALQPLNAPTQRSTAASAPPFWGEVRGALAVVHTICSADAPIVTRIGHGGVLRVVDYLPASSSSEIDWYGVADDESGDLLGWSQTPDWSLAEIDYAKPNLTLHVDAGAMRLEARAGERPILDAPISIGQDLTPGVYSITDRRPSAVTGHHGTAWLLDFDGRQLSGVYWHNQFGAPVSGTAIQVTPALAKWLFPRAEKVIVY